MTRDSHRPDVPLEAAPPNEREAPPLDLRPAAPRASDTDDSPVARPDVDYARTARGVFLGIVICVIGWAVAAAVWRLLLL
jgi:hypothetical protein